jgi:hypothetical protein
MSTLMHSGVATSNWQAGFLHVLPAVQTHARIQFRHLPAVHREEAIQEAIASACVSYQLLAAKGRLHDAHHSTLADFAVRHVRAGRHVGGSQDATKDVLSPAAAKCHGVRVVSYDKRGWGGSDGWKQLAIEGRRRVSIPDLAAFRIDFARWLRTLSHRDRKIISAMVTGEGTNGVAGRFGMSRGRVSQLRRRYENLWQAFQGQGNEAA